MTYKKFDWLLKKTDILLYILTAIIALIGLLGWTFGELSLAKYSQVYIPIAPATSISFVFLSLFSIILKRKIREIVTFFQIISSILFLFFIYIVLAYALTLSWDIESVFVSAPDKFGKVKTGRMSPLTAILFIIEYFSLILLYSAKKRRLNNLIWILIIASLYISTIILVGYIYDEPILYGGNIIPVALPTAICFWLIGISQLYFVRSKMITFHFLHLTSTAQKLIIAFLPVVVVIVVFQGFIYSRNFFMDNQILVSALMLLILIPFVIFIVITISKSIGNSLEEATKSLVKTKNELSRVQEITKTGSWYLDIATNEVTWTEELYKMYGFDPKLPVPPYHEHMKLFTKDSWDLLSKSLAKTAETGIPYELELNTVREDGSNGWMWVRGEVHKDEKGNIIGLWGAAQDITKEKINENKLKESYNLLNKLTSMVPGVVYQYRLYPDGHSAFPISSSGMWDIYEVTPEEVQEDASPVFTRIHPEDYDMIVETINKSAENLTLYHQEYRVILPKQGLRWRLCDAKPERLEDGSTLWYGIITDITERKSAEVEILKAKEKAEVNEKELLKNKFLLNETGHVAKVGGWEIDIFGNTLAWTDETFKIHELSTDIQPNVEDAMSFYHSDDQKMVATEVECAIKNGQPFDFEARLITAKSNQKWVRASGKPVLKQGNTVGVRGSIQDISHQKRTELELIKAKEKAEESERLKTAFLANMSHEIRTPMNGILGFTELLQDHDLTGEQQQQYIEIIQKSGDRMLSTVNDIIEISKIETGQVQIFSNKINIKEHLKTLHKFFILEAEGKGLKLMLEDKLNEDDSLIKTDKNKLGSVLTNLIKNAIKFTPKGTVAIGCKKNDNLLEFYVKDSGIGIPSTRKEAIFNRFEQADIEDRQVHEGSGLGLSIAKSYVEMLGGTIWVESEENKGSTFFFTISYNPADPETKTVKTTVSEVADNANNLNVLIVEDDDTGALYLSTILKDSAKMIQIAKDGLEAVEMCKTRSNFDLVLMDVKLPSLNGLEATKRIREFNKNVKIIAQTAYALEGDKEQAIKAGCNDYISKPINRDKLIELIHKYFN